MNEYQNLAHTRWVCKVHVVFIPRMRKKKIFKVLRQRNQEAEDERYDQMQLDV